MARCHSKRLLFANSWWGRLLSVGSMRVRGDFVWSEILERERERKWGMGKIFFWEKGFCDLSISPNKIMWVVAFIGKWGVKDFFYFISFWFFRFVNWFDSSEAACPNSLMKFESYALSQTTCQINLSTLWLLQILLHLVMSF